MNALEIIRKLSAASAGEGPPRISVVGPVLARLRGRQRSAEPVFWLSGVLAAVAASVVLAIALSLGGGQQQDSLASMFTSVITFLE